MIFFCQKKKTFKIMTKRQKIIIIAILPKGEIFLLPKKRIRKTRGIPFYYVMDGKIVPKMNPFLSNMTI